MVYKSAKKLNDRQRAAIDAYFENGFEIKAALLSAGYSPITAQKAPGKVWYVPVIQEEIERRRQKLAEKHEVTQDWLIQEFVKRATSGQTLAKFKIVQKDGTLAWDFTGATPEELALVGDLTATFEKLGRGKDAIDVKKFGIKEPDAQAALMALGRHLGFFNDKIEVTGSLAERIKQARHQGYQPGKSDDENKETTVH